MDFDKRLVDPPGIVERGIELGGWQVVELAVQAAGVVPVHPAQGGQFEALDGLPGRLGPARRMMCSGLHGVGLLDFWSRHP
ncbi:MAG: hypothetical protein K0U78_06595 [Actinomycetia bacterium]|nr:hypothetical protein [Actinomycetes bacterium]